MMTKVTRSGTDLSFLLEMSLPKIDPLPAVVLKKTPVKAVVTLKRTDPKSEVGTYILTEFEKLLQRSVDLRLQALGTSLVALWKQASKAVAAAKTPDAAKKVADKVQAQAQKQMVDFAKMLETSTIPAALTQARKAAEKKFKDKLGAEESVTVKGTREFTKQAYEVGEAVVGVAEAVSDVVESAINPIKTIKTLIALSKGKADVIDKTVDLYRKVSKSRPAKLARIKERFSKSKALFAEVQGELDELKAMRNALSSVLSSTTGQYDKLDRQIDNVSNLDFARTRKPLFDKLRGDGQAAGKVMDEVAKTLVEREALQKKVNAAIKAIDDVMMELDIEIKVSSTEQPVLKRLEELQARHKQAVGAIQKAA